MTPPADGGARVRFFTSAALRVQEEVPGEVVAWLPQSITVEYDGEVPTCGVWRALDGRRRACWYASEVTPELVAAHEERYGDEAFWVIDRARLRERVVEVIECDAAGSPQAMRRWLFDACHMPAKEEVHAIGGELQLTRTYECTDDGCVYRKAEFAPGAAPIALPRPHRFPIPELAGEPYPCGGTIGRDGPRIIETIQQNQNQGRHHAIYRDGATWRRGLVTRATSKGWRDEVRPTIDVADPGVATLVRTGELLDRRNQGYTSLGLVEELPDGRTLEAVVSEGAIGIDAAIDVALAVAAVATRAHAAGHALGGIRPELIYLRASGGRLAMTRIAHRGPAVISQYYGGETIVWPPVYAADFSSTDDATGLAQLVWYMVTGGHPFLAPENLRWQPSWNEFRHGVRRRQPWTGPAELGALLERALFTAAPMAFDALVAALARLRGGAAPYR